MSAIEVSGLRTVFRCMPPRWQNELKAWRDGARIRRRHEQAVAQLKQTANGISSECLEDIHSLNDWQQRRLAIREQARFMLGLDNAAADRGPVEARITGVLDRPRYRVERVVFQSLPNLYVTGNFYAPKGVDGPAPCILYLCGHMPHPLGAKTQYQDRYQWYASHGFACLALDPLEFGEVSGIHRGTHSLNLWHWISLGYTPAGVEVWNAMRALDWLATKPEVDCGRIGVTGISGGGVMSSYLSALDERIRVVAPSCSAYTIGSQATHGAIDRQCDCTYYPNVFMLDFPAIAALIAPRPLLLTAGQRDPLFPPAGYREVFRRVKRIYDLYEDAGGDARIKLVEASGGHADLPVFLRETRQWMQRWLLQSDACRNDAMDGDSAAALETPEALACLDRWPLNAANYSIHDRFVSAASPVAPKSQREWVERRCALLARLKSHVFRWFPQEPIPYATRTLDGHGDYTALYANFAERVFDAEVGAPIRATVFKPKAPAAKSGLLIVIKGAHDHVFFPDTDELLPLLPLMNVMVLSPRFTEHNLSASEFASIERTAVMTGRSVASLQVWDLIRTVRWALEEEGLAPETISVYGRGQAGIVALYAALFEERIGHVILKDPPSSHWQQPALPTILRFTDTPEIAGALAPRRLTWIGKIPLAFEVTRQIYALAGAEQALRSAPSLPDALRSELKRDGSGNAGERGAAA